MLPNIGIDISEQEKLFKQYDAAFSDKSIDFSTQLSNLWASQLEMVAKYGSDGLALLLDHETRVYESDGNKRSLQIMHYSDMPKKCPWYAWLHLSKEELIAKLWGHFSKEFVNTLSTYCIDIFVIFEAKKWYLAYTYKTKNYDGAEYYEFLGGRQGDPKAKLPVKLERAGWKMPEDLKELYAIHGNFGGIKSALRNDICDCVPSSGKLKASLAFLEKYVEEWEVDYSFHNLLPFWEDGAGNSQNFYKAEPTAGSYVTVDWDHETKEISGARSLTEFVVDHYTKKLEGEW